jgi:hypothetical protein
MRRYIVLGSVAGVKALPHCSGKAAIRAGGLPRRVKPIRLGRVLGVSGTGETIRALGDEGRSKVESSSRQRTAKYGVTTGTMSKQAAESFVER